jgi:serine/threonine protein kinase
MSAVWSLGVIAFEAIVNERALKGKPMVVACAHGVQPYPWELPLDEQHLAWRNSRLSRLVAPALARDPADRPTAAELYHAVNRVGQVTNSSGTS